MRPNKNIAKSYSTIVSSIYTMFPSKYLNTSVACKFCDRDRDLRLLYL